MSLHLDTTELMALSTLKQCILAIPEDREFPVTDGLTLLRQSKSVAHCIVAETAIRKVLERL